MISEMKFWKQRGHGKDPVQLSATEMSKAMSTRSLKLLAFFAGAVLCIAGAVSEGLNSTNMMKEVAEGLTEQKE
jgi:hypothetical protein